MDDLYLMHHGILGMHWGVRRYQNQDGSLTDAGKVRYSSDQRRRDERVYGRGGAKRIERRIEKGDSISGARSAESDRIYSTRRRAQVAGQIGSTIGSIGGAIGGLVGSKAVNNLLTQYGGDIFQDPSVKLAVSSAVSIGASAVGSSLGRTGGRAVGMISGGYSPSKYR